MVPSFDKAKKFVTNALPALPALPRPPSFRPDKELDSEDVRDARDYIANYWAKVERFHPKDDESLLGLPKPYLVPSYRQKTGFDYNEMYYWDSYFMVQGMLDTEHQELVSGILENLMFLFERFKVIPNASRTYLTGRSQPPFLSTFIFDVYQQYNPGDEWLKEAIHLAEREYRTVWMGIKKPNERQVHKGLSRHYDINYLHDLAEAESGWDMTPRFDRRALNFLPVDLNALLYKYETDFARAARIFGDVRTAAKWDDAAEQRKTTMNALMWDRIRGLYYDYNYVKGKRSATGSLAAYYPMWAGMVTDKQAAALVKALRKFEHKGGLATTDALPFGQFVLGSLPTQWAYPNGWAPLHFIVVKALERYGYHQDARRIAMKWLKTNMQWYNTEHVFLEKYNVVLPEKPPVKGLYPSQTGFGWTNAIFERFCQDYVDRPL
ncbi:alpha,alpha-trehalase [Candidatus Saccharibacteria bacterium CG_4_10_14_0_2_um_filter_52_9]|nr:MAG: alpha,alpha-trehalase [Candidatus Saccharibacteria bacterium CG_4_10_14_0_2_um_filter_52_9]